MISRWSLQAHRPSRPGTPPKGVRQGVITCRVGGQSMNMYLLAFGERDDICKITRNNWRGRKIQAAILTRRLFSTSTKQRQTTASVRRSRYPLFCCKRWRDCSCWSACWQMLADGMAGS